jgi:hypothetical protein
MAKIGRNTSCPCGSQKKYKRCCGSRPARKAMTATDNPMSLASTYDRSLKMDPIGLPDLLQHLISRPQYHDPEDARNLGGPQGLPGMYKVVFTLLIWT